MRKNPASTSIKLGLSPAESNGGNPRRGSSPLSRPSSWDHNVTSKTTIQRNPAQSREKRLSPAVGLRRKKSPRAVAVNPGANAWPPCERTVNGTPSGRPNFSARRHKSWRRKECKPSHRRRASCGLPNEAIRPRKNSSQLVTWEELAVEGFGRGADVSGTRFDPALDQPVLAEAPDTDALEPRRFRQADDPLPRER